MPLADVTNPVIINATSAVLQESGDFLRRVCFVSFGETNLLAKEFKEVFRSDYSKILNGHTELTNSLNNFFTRANNKSCVVLELGEQEGTPLEDSYSNKIKYLNNQSWFSFSDFCEWLYDTKWIISPNEETEAILKAYWNSVNTFNESQYQTFLTTNRLSASVESLKKFLKYLDSNWDRDYYVYLSEHNEKFKEFLTLDNLNEFLNLRETANYNDDNYHIWLEENGTYDNDYTEKIEDLNDFILQRLYPCYIYVLPNQLSKEDNLRKNLFEKYTEINAKTFFFVNLDISENLEATNAYYQKIKGLKSVAGFFDNTENKVGLASTVAGLFASNVFDISDLNPASPFNYKILNGSKYNELEYSTQQDIIQKGLNYLSDISGNTVLLNGRYQDLVAIDYWYQWDLVAFYLERDLKTLILNGVNNPINIVKYNQDGIDILESRVKATLANMINNGCVTEYAAAIDSATGEMISKGDLSVISFNDYIRANPDDYKNEIYKGISFYLRIGKYIRQVVLNATLG